MKVNFCLTNFENIGIYGQIFTPTPEKNFNDSHNFSLSLAHFPLEKEELTGRSNSRFRPHSFFSLFLSLVQLK